MTARRKKMLVADLLCGAGGGRRWHLRGEAKHPRAPLAQMDRAPDFESGGRRFESFGARQPGDIS